MAKTLRRKIVRQLHLKFLSKLFFFFNAMLKNSWTSFSVDSLNHQATLL